MDNPKQLCKESRELQKRSTDLCAQVRSMCKDAQEQLKEMRAARLMNSLDFDKLCVKNILLKEMLDNLKRRFKR